MTKAAIYEVDGLWMKEYPDGDLMRRDLFAEAALVSGAPIYSLRQTFVKTWHEEGDGYSRERAVELALPLLGTRIEIVDGILVSDNWLDADESEMRIDFQSARIPAV